MPLSAEHKQQTRAKIVEAARLLFNRHGFEGVSINEIMTAAGLTRGGFYNHFKNKDALYAEAVSSFLMGRGAQWRAEAGVDPARPSAEMARHMINGYLSTEHLGDLEGQCPMIALPSDVARASPQVQESYQQLLAGMVGLFECSLETEDEKNRPTALSLAALCVGGMILARTLPNNELADEVRLAALTMADSIITTSKERRKLGRR